MKAFELFVQMFNNVSVNHQGVKMAPVSVKGTGIKER